MKRRRGRRPRQQRQTSLTLRPGQECLQKHVQGRRWKNQCGPGRPLPSSHGLMGRPPLQPNPRLSLQLRSMPHGQACTAAQPLSRRQAETPCTPTLHRSQSGQRTPPSCHSLQHLLLPLRLWPQRMVMQLFPPSGPRTYRQSCRSLRYPSPSLPPWLQQALCLWRGHARNP